MCEHGGSLLDMSSPPPPASPDGALRYRVDRTGTTIAVLPACVYLVMTG
jgi:hypothetical protein